jgi:hypothetical protein
MASFKSLNSLVRCLVMLAGFATLAQAARAEDCYQVAQRAYDRAFLACTGGGDECRYDSDCSFGRICDRGQCVLDDHPTTCVRNCTARWSDGSCREYGPDFCGPDASCTQYCSARWSDGSCREYGPDQCGRDITCTPHCLDRWSNGSCREWGPDICN